MAMTKKERAEFDAAILRAEAALRCTAPVERDLPIPKYGEPPTSGWDFNSYDWGRVFRAWSESNSHGTGPSRSGMGSQGGVALFSTKEKALAALRHKIEVESAKRLLACDKGTVAQD